MIRQMLFENVASEIFLVENLLRYLPQCDQRKNSGISAYENYLNRIKW